MSRHMDVESPNFQSGFDRQGESFEIAAPHRKYFEGEVPKTKLGFGYTMGLLVVALAMIVLPLIYVGLVTMAVLGIYWYATRMSQVFFPVIGGTRHISFALTMLFLAPILAGVILVWFMLAPIFSGFRFRQMSRPIGHEENPELFRLLGELCQMLGAPIPSRVDLQLGVNASASFRAGFGSMFGNDIKLSIGLPLIAGLTCAEFAGVLAHELGHFRQHTAMRLRYIIAIINGWFARAVYQGDDSQVWTGDETGGSLLVLLAIGLAKVGIGVTRGILWVLMMFGHAISSYLYRQMEFDADGAAIAVIGTRTFLTLNHKIGILDFAEKQTFVEYRTKIQPKLPDDLSAYIAVTASQCAGELQVRVARALESQKGRWWDSHPSHKQRNDRARATNLPGLIHDARPATCLFGDFPQISKEFTRGVYSFLPRPPRADQIFKVEMPANSVPDTAQPEAVVKEFFRGLGLVIKPILTEAEARPPLMASEKMERLRAAEALLAGTDLFVARERLKELDSRLMEAVGTQALLQGGLIEQTDGMAHPETTISQLQAEWNSLAAEIEPFEKAAKDRLLILLALLRSPGMSSKLGNTQELHDEAEGLKHVHGVLSLAFPALLLLRQQFAKLQALLPHRAAGSSEFLDAAIANEAQETKRLLEQIKDALGTTAYPFRHAKANVSLMDFARTKEFTPDPVQMTFKEAESHLQMLFALYFQVLGRLATIARQVEVHLSPVPNQASDQGSTV
jgi:Zn-dependent protease with chaperone function